MSEHYTKEPWSVGSNLNGDIAVTDGGSNVICMLKADWLTGFSSKDNAERIVACVNALEDFNTEELKAGLLEELLYKQGAKLTVENHRLTVRVKELEMAILEYLPAVWSKDDKRTQRMADLVLKDKEEL